MSRIQPTFTPNALQEELCALPEASRYLVGFSGGADSTALLLAMHQLVDKMEARVEAVHFNHGLQEESGRWQAHCAAICEKLAIPFHAYALDLQVNRKRSPELESRQARYSIIESILSTGDVYLTAHQADDQAETLFLNLMRGSGADGLAGIPPARRLGNGWVARPLLNFSRKQLQEFLQQQAVEWKDDPSNLDQAIDRNFVRATIFPLLEGRWPSLANRLNRTADHLRDQGLALTEALALCEGLVSTDDVTLSMERFQTCSRLLQAEVLRYWAKQEGALPPPASRLQEFLSQLQQTRAGSQAEMRWKTWRIKQHANRLWFQEMPELLPCPSVQWSAGSHIELGEVHGHLALQSENRDNPGIQRLGKTWICARTAVAQFQANGTDLNVKIKEIMRLYGIPPWLRNSVPLLMVDGQLAAIGDAWLSAEFKKQLQLLQANYCWQPADPVLTAIRTLCKTSTVDHGTSLV